MEKVEKYAFYLLLASLLIPLTLKTDLLLFYTWNFAAIGLIVVSFPSLVRKKQIKKIHPWEIALFAFCIILTVTTLFGRNTGENLPHLVQFITAILLGIYARREWNKKIDFKVLCIFFILVAVSQSVVGIIQQVTLSSFGNPQAYFGAEKYESLINQSFSEMFTRVQGTFGTSNIAGCWLVVSIPFVYISSRVSLVRSSKWWSYLRILGLSLATVTICLTFSRGNILLSLISFIGLFYFKKKEYRIPYYETINAKSNYIIYALLFSIFAYFIISNLHNLLFIYELLTERFSTVQKVADRGSDTNIRMEMVYGAIEYVIEHPLWGAGFNNSAGIWNQVSAEIPPDKFYRPHNVYLIIAVEGGMIALALWVLIMAMPFIKMFKGALSGDMVCTAFLLAIVSILGFMLIYVIPLSGELAPLIFMLLGSSIGHYEKKQRYYVREAG